MTAAPSLHDGQQSHVIGQVYSIDARAVSSFHSTLGVHGVAHNAGVYASLDWRVLEACLCIPASRRLRFLTQTVYQPNRCVARAVCELCNMRHLKKPRGWGWLRSRRAHGYHCKTMMASIKEIAMATSTLDSFMGLLLGRFDNREQFEAKKVAGEVFPFARHVNTACNDKILDLPADFPGVFMIEESYYETDGKNPRHPICSSSPRSRKVFC